MIFYLLNKKQRVIKAISSKKIIEAHFVEGINQANQLVLSLPLKERLKSNIFYALFEKPDSTEYLMFKLINEDVQNDRVTYNGVDAAYDELKGYGYVKDIRPVKRTAKEILQRVLQDTRWEVGYIDSTNPVDTNFYYQTYLDCIQQIVKLFNLEVTFTYGFDTRHQQITSRKVNLYLQQGRRTGKRFEYGSNLLEVTREEDSQNIVTALVGRGKGEEKYDDSTGEPTDGYGRRIGFSDVVWSKANGDPVDKPLGQEYVEDPEATKIFGYDDGKPRTGVIVFDDIDDPVELLKATWASLKSSDRPKVSFKAQVTDVGNLQLGDTIAIIRHEISIEYFTRVFKVDHDLLNKNNSTIEMGDDMSDRSLYSYISDVDATANQAVQSANQAVVSAGSKNKNYYATTKPAVADEGDNLWLNLGNGEFEHWVWHNHQWQFINSTQDLKNVEQNVNSAKDEIEKAKQDIITNKEQANEAISTLTKTVTGIQGQVADGVSKAEFQALSNQVNLKVSKGDVVGQLNIDAGKTLIQNNKILLDAESVIFGGKAFIPDAAITNISADKINAGTLDAGKINVINLNADNIVAGTLSGKNINMNLTTGDIRFTAGRFHNADDTFDINIDENYLFSEGVVDKFWNEKSNLLIKDGQLTLTQDTWLDPDSKPYLRIYRDEGFAIGGVVGNALAQASVIAGNESIALAQNTLTDEGIEEFHGPFYEQKDENGNWVQSYFNSDFVGVGVSRPYGSGMFLNKVPYAIYISSKNMQTQMSGAKITITGSGNAGDAGDTSRIEIGTKGWLSGLSQDNIGTDIAIKPGKDLYLSVTQTTGNSANLYLEPLGGRALLTTSASKYKQDIVRSHSTEYGEKLLNIPVATWRDKSEIKRCAETGEQPKTYYGMIAEDLDEAGLSMLVTKSRGEVTGINYDRIGVALVPVVKELKDKINELEAKVNEQSKSN